MTVSDILALLGILLSLNHIMAMHTVARQRAFLLRHILRHERKHLMAQKRDHPRPEPTPHECCPSITRGILPLGGLSREGTLLELFRDRTMVQKFYETTCASGVANNACRFLDLSAGAYSQCEQKYTYMYAIVKDFNVTQPYRIDYMRVKSGCSCTVYR